MARKYSKKASKYVKKAMRKRKKGTLKSGGSGKKVKSQQAGDRHWAVRGAPQGCQGAEAQERRL